ncbi:MAG: 16S rRNA (uracil(1498)-N(3))-methyltransferase [Clostridiales bacterium]|jgi:16S rRNA (uracil1498-N3)-methyltransferase|nr:16S rRNA (uracil(1498)-N(3))-methyltransferase [Clostridiales bacterium]
MSSARRVFCPKIESKLVFIEGDEHKHISVVLRCKVGDAVVVWCGDGFDYHGVVVEIKKSHTVVDIVQKSKTLAEPKINVTLYMGILKNTDRMEFAIQKCIELGVSKIVPFISKNSVAKYVNVSRMNKIVLNAVKQCGRSVLVPIDEPCSFVHVLEQLSSQETVMFAYEKATFPICEKLQTDIFLNATQISVVVGSEGGFDVEEIAKLNHKNIVPIKLGQRILRAETASIAVMSLLSLTLNI